MVDMVNMVNMVDMVDMVDRVDAVDEVDRQIRKTNKYIYIYKDTHWTGTKSITIQLFFAQLSLLQYISFRHFVIQFDVAAPYPGVHRSQDPSRRSSAGIGCPTPCPTEDSHLGPRFVLARCPSILYNK